MADESTSSLEEQFNKYSTAIPHLGNKLSTSACTEDMEQACAKMAATMDSLETAQEGLKEHIKDLLAAKEREETKLKRLHRNQQEPALEKAMAELDTAKREMMELEEQAGHVAATIQHKKDLLAKEKEAGYSAIHMETKAALQKIKAEYLTYSKLTGLKWDDTAPSNVLKGYILQPHKKEVIPFKFERTSSQFFITNYLWERIAAGSNFSSFIKET